MSMQEIDSFFAYGTLMCEDIMKEISACRLSHVPGIVRGYSRRSVRGEYYAGLIPSEDGRVEGVVYRHLPNSTWERLDRFEGNMYQRSLGSVGKLGLASSGPFSAWLHPAASTIQPTSPASPSLPGEKMARSRADEQVFRQSRTLSSRNRS